MVRPRSPPSPCCSRTWCCWTSSSPVSTASRPRAGCASAATQPLCSRRCVSARTTVIGWSSAAPTASSGRLSCRGPRCAWRRWEVADEMSPRLRLGVVLVAVAAGLVNLALLLLHRSALDAPPTYLVINLVGVCWSFVAAGLVALAHRPGNRTGWLMIAFGLAWSLHGLAVLGGPLPSPLLFLMATLPDAILGHLIAVFPEGRATTRLQ